MQPAVPAEHQGVERMEHTMFLTQIIGCIVAALVVAVLWLGVELHRVNRRIDRRDGRDDSKA